jgi:SAM-dependent methyltransferase
VNKIYTTEITSAALPSDNPLHQRLLFPYLAAPRWISGSLLEVGCGEGRGIENLLPAVNNYTAIDKIEAAISALRSRYPQARFVAGHLPPLPFADAQFDSVVTFQVIEHIADDRLFLAEARRVLKPGGVLLLTTPNRRLSLSRNPWHIREYEANELQALARQVFDHAEVKGIAGNEKVMAYHEENRKAVQRLMRWDVFNLQHRLPAGLLKAPYEWLNRRNRNKLHQATPLAQSITADDYFISDNADEALDLFLIARRD